MKKSTILAALAAASGIAAAQGTVVVDLDVNGRVGSGGPFEVNVTGFTGNDAAANGTYLTFCVELNEFISDDSTNQAVINTAAVNGGVGFADVPGSDVFKPADAGRDPLSAHSAYVYTEFRKGVDDSADDGNDFTIGMTSLDMEAVQLALWYFENEVVLTDTGFERADNNAAIGTVDGTDRASDIILAALAAVGDGENGIWTGLGGVRVMNMGTDGSPRQDLLTIIPLPSGSALAAAGLGLVAVRRRRSL